MERTAKRKRLAVATIIIGLLTGAILCTSGTYLQNQKEDPIAGSAGALPTLTEYADFNCPYCADFALIAMPEIRREFIDPGLIEYKYAHFPFLANSSIIAAEASECARDQGSFKPYHDALYRIVADKQGQLNADDMTAAAEATALEPAQFNECFEGRDHRRTVERDTANARKAGVRGTPTLLLNGTKIRWRDYDDLRAQLLRATSTNRE